MLALNKVVSTLGTVSLAILAVGLAWYLFDGLGCKYVVPFEHDSHLVGTWIGPPDFPRSFRLRADGTGEFFVSTRFLRRMTWGTQSGRLDEKFMSTDAWASPRYEYRLSTDGKTLTLKYANNPRSIPMSYSRAP